jgi:hypothetical protein
VLRRDFTGGMVLVNPPGSSTQTIALPAAMQDQAGTPVSSVTLPPASGAVLRGSVPPEAAAQEGPAEFSTQTTLEAKVIRPQHAPRSAARVRAGAPGKHGRARHRRGRGKRRARAARRTRSPAGRRAGVLTRLAGVVRRATRGRVVVDIEARRGRRWVQLTRASLSVTPAGRFLSLLRLHAGGRYRASATYTGVAGYRPSWSGYRLIVVRRG